jgi:hypothetical protein
VIGRILSHQTALWSEFSFGRDHGGALKPAFGYCVSHGGQSVVISGETRFSENLIRHAAGAMSCCTRSSPHHPTFATIRTCSSAPLTIHLRPMPRGFESCSRDCSKPPLNRALLAS